jgi:hypothetical protein
MIDRIGLHELDRSGAADGQVAAWDAASGTWKPIAPPATGVAAVTGAGTVTVDSTDPAHPVVRGAELLMADGVTSPPVPIETEAGDDWLYEG